MIKKFVFGRVSVFIDVANILYSQRTLKWSVSYEKLKKYFEDECNLVSVHFYTGKVGTNIKQNDFLNKIKNFGYIVFSKEIKKIRLANGSFKLKGNLDVELTLGVLSNIESFETLILMSGDGDFAPLLDLVKDHKKRVLVMSAKGHVAKELLNRAKYINLNKLKDYISL